MSDAHTGLYLRTAAPWTVLRDALAAAYGIPRTAVVLFDEADDSIVRVDMVDHDEGCKQQVDLYLDLTRVRGVAIVRLAAHVAAATGCDVVYDDESTKDPFEWALVDAAGATRRVTQSIEDLDGLVLNEP
ncbi:MAG: hypothetical protein ABI321_24185 [Polyangia bacterium]